MGKVVAQPSKQGWLYVFERQTGKPIWPIEERPVEKGTVPGEWYSPTQPFVTKPPPFELQGITAERPDRFHARDQGRSAEAGREYKTGPLFTPPIMSGEGGKQGLLFVANGANWPGGALRPRNRHALRLLAYADPGRRARQRADPKRSNMDYITGPGGERSRAHRAGHAARETAMGTHHRDRYDEGATSPGRSPTAKPRTS